MTARKYSPIWEMIKAVPVGQEVPVRVHQSAAATLKQAVKKEKNRDVGIKNKLGILAPGKLTIREVSEGVQPPDNVIVYFSLSFDGGRL